MTITAEDLVGQTVISWRGDHRFAYDGPHEHQGWTSMKFDIRYGSLTALRCDFDKVAPADITIPVKDARVVVTKSSKEEARAHGASYPDGIWRLDLPEQRPTWHKTKRDATSEGLRRVAIMDWHAANKEGATA